MKKTTSRIIYTGLDILTQMGFDLNDILITGSAALDIYGLLPEDREVHDLDVLVRNTTSPQRMGLKMIDALSNVGRSVHYDDNNFYAFDLKGVIINIWAKDFDGEIKHKCGAWLSPVDKCLDAKKTYGRSKDYKDLADIARYILETV